MTIHDDVIKWKQFPCYWSFVRGIHRSPVNSPHKGQWRGALMFSLICIWIYGWVNNCEVSGLRRYHAHYDVTVMIHRPKCELDILRYPHYPLETLWHRYNERFSMEHAFVNVTEEWRKTASWLTFYSVMYFEDLPIRACNFVFNS